ncbi:MAG TPA: cache domain-containing protein [Candidatus Binatia bacterium]|nr:cache domain-containing protein [Candidatus Binatia bacterium]
MTASPGPGPAAARPRFISLKWKTLVLVSLVLTAIHVLLVLQGYRDALRQFHERQALAFENRAVVLRTLLDQSAARLVRVSNLVPGVLRAAVRNVELQDQWQAVQLELQLEIMQLYDAHGRLLLGGAGLWREPPAPLRERIQAALHEERPGGLLLCQPECVQYMLTPVLGSRGERELMVLGVSLADVVLDFPGMSGADVALLVEDSAGEGYNYWQRYRLAAVSDAPSNEPKVRALAEQAGLAELEQGVSLSFSGRHYRFYARPLGAFGSLTPGWFLVFGDTTEALSDIRDQVQRQLAAGLTALLAALALLLSILNRPMNQLRKLAQTLPMLAQREYASARSLIGEGFRTRRSQTEIEVLEGASVDLSRKLEELEQTVAARSEALAEKIAELKRAHELNEKIFATAPLIFLIQSRDGRVLQMNHFGSQLLGYSESEVQGMPFLSLLADARLRAAAGDVIADVLAGRRPLYEQTGPVKCVDGSLEQVTWLHTRLAAQSGNYVLSVGLPDKTLAETGH